MVLAVASPHVCHCIERPAVISLCRCLMLGSSVYFYGGLLCQVGVYLRVYQQQILGMCVHCVCV